MRIDQDVLAVLEQAQTTGAGGIVLTGQLERKLYERVNKVLVATGWQWNRKAKAHIHPNADADDALESMLSTGEVITNADYGFFPTQGDALDMLMDAAMVGPGELVLEPSAGSGNIVRACLDKGASIHACELHDERRAALDGILGVTVFDQPDFLSINPIPVFNKVVMNPPFARQQDLDHVLHALKFLAPGGRLVTIMASGVRYRSNAKTMAFHETIMGYSPIWDELPAYAFKASGTSVNTVLLRLDRPSAPVRHRTRQLQPVAA